MHRPYDHEAHIAVLAFLVMHRDLCSGRCQALLSYGGRVSRFTAILKNTNKRTEPIMGKILNAMKDLRQLPEDLLRLIEVVSS